MLAIALAAAACAVPAVRAKAAGRPLSVAGDYLLLLAALLISADLAYAERQFTLLGPLWSWHLLLLIEDGMAENDWDGWKLITQTLGASTQLVGDDLFVTNVEYLSKGIDLGVANSILIKVNQIGTLTETLDAIEMAPGPAIPRS